MRDVWGSGVGKGPEGVPYPPPRPGQMRPKFLHSRGAAVQYLPGRGGGERTPAHTRRRLSRGCRPRPKVRLWPGAAAGKDGPHRVGSWVSVCPGRSQWASRFRPIPESHPRPGMPAGSPLRPVLFQTLFGRRLRSRSPAGGLDRGRASPRPVPAAGLPPLAVPDPRPALFVCWLPRPGPLPCPGFFEDGPGSGRESMDSSALPRRRPTRRLTGSRSRRRLRTLPQRARD